MKNDLSQSSVATYTTRRKNKSIWLRCCMIVALVVVVLTGYVLVFPAQTVERELICTQKEHVHDEGCWVRVLTCGREEGEDHIHSEECWTDVLICGLEEHVHGEECYAELEPAPVLTEAELTTEPPIELPTTPPDDDGSEPSTEPAFVDFPLELPTEPGVTEPGVTEPGEGPEPVDPDEPKTEPELTEPEETEPEELDPHAVDDFVTLRLAQLSEIIQTIVYPDEGIDLAPYLESVNFQVDVGGVLVYETYFENGMIAKASIVYNIPKDIVTPDSKYVYYQLLDGVRPIEETTGEVMNEGVGVGVYTITEDGRIHILFNDEFANGNAIVGTVEFTSWLYANEDGTDRVIEFENGAGTITIHVPDGQKYSLELAKTGEFSENYTSADFVLTISSELGTGSPITTVDVLTNQTPATLFSAVYSQDITIRHVAVDGTVTLISGVNITWSPDGTSFTVEELPALEAGERYELCYSVDLEPDLSANFELDNEATATAGTLEATTNFFITYTCDITKSGSFNPVTGLIDWIITINPESRPVAGWYIEDILPSPPVGKVLLTNANGVVYAEIVPIDGTKICYTFPGTAPARPYFLRYSTAAPTTPQTVSNTVHLYNGQETTVTSEVTVTERLEGVDKTRGAQFAEPGGYVRTLWSFEATLPVGELDSYSIRDTISSPVLDENEIEYLDSSLHFSYAAALEEAFRGNLRLISDGVEYRYGDEANTYVNFELTYYNALGQTVDPTDTTTHVSRLTLVVTPQNGETFHGYEIVADNYPTWLDVRQAENGDIWTYQNYIRLQGGATDAAYGSYRKSNVFRKQMLVNGRYTDDSGYLDYAACGGELEYRLLLDLTALEGEEFTVSDLLPAGTELMEDSVRVFFTSAALNGEYDGVFAEAGSGTFTVTQEPGADGTTQVAFHGTGVSDLMKQTYAYLVINYRVRLTEDIWNDYTHTVAQYSNTAVWNEYMDSHTATVENFPKRIEKNGVQLTDTEGNPLSRVRFTLEINLGAEDLDPESDWITLSDVLSSYIGADLELSSVKLYYFDVTKPDHLGNRVMPYEFNLNYDTDTRTMTVRLRDETAYVLVYDYTVDNAEIVDEQTQINNAASLAGVFRSSSQVVLQGVSSSATAWQRVITITKVDEDNYGKVLPGAEFTLEYWDPELQAWVPVKDEEGQPRTYISNEAGKIVLTMLGTDKDLVSGSLYRLTETEAPLGYENDNTVLYFICMPRVRDEAHNVFEEAAAGSGVEFEDVTFFQWNGGSCVITNPFKGLTVDKRWFNLKGEEMDEVDPESITVRLYSSPDPTGDTEPTPVKDENGSEIVVTITSANDWTYTWEKLPTTDEMGDPIYYFVAEDPVPGFTPTYINNGITGGTIVIQNDSEPYELPATGSNGSRVLVVIGATLMLLAAAVYIKIKFKKMEVTK